MKTTIISLLLSLTFFVGYTQSKNDNFPKNALGIYKGKLIIDSPRGKQEVAMEFHMKKTDSINRFDYKLVYNGQPRNYTLVVKDKAKGVYEVDENNGIILPSKFSGDTLYSFFEVSGNFLSSRMQFLENEMHFEILVTITKNKTTTGGTSKDIPEVFGYPIMVVQKAILKKVE